MSSSPKCDSTMKIEGHLVLCLIHQMENLESILIEHIMILLVNQEMFDWACV